MHEKLYRSRTDRMLTGVCGGVAAHYDLDSTLVRLATVIVLLLTNVLGVVVYFVCGMVIPLEPGAALAGAPGASRSAGTPPSAMPELADAYATAREVDQEARPLVERTE